MSRTVLCVLAAWVSVAVPSTALAADPAWVSPVSDLNALGGAISPKVAVNARGDMVVAWLDPVTTHVFESERPAGGTFSTGAAVSALNTQALGSVAIDGSGLVYVFIGSDVSTPAASRPRVETRQIGAGGAWTDTPLAAASSADPPLTAMGAVASSGQAIAIWSQGHTAGNEFSKYEYATKPAGSTTWAAKADITGMCGCGDATAPPQTPALAIDQSGDAATVWSRYTSGFGTTFVVGDTYTKATNTWSGASNLSSNNLSGAPVVAMDATGQATAAWTRTNNLSHPIVQFSSKALSIASWTLAPDGTNASPGANDLSPTGSDAGQPTVAVEPDGRTTIAWARNGAIEQRTRPSGGAAFAALAVIPNSTTASSGPFLIAGPGGGVVALWNGTSAGSPVIGAARRLAGAAAFTALPNVPGIGNAAQFGDWPFAGIDDQGNVGAAWEHNSSGNYQVEATGLDAAAPTISNVSFPATGTAGTAVSYSATATDRWSSLTTSWAFGDGATGPLSGTHTYATAGSFLATLTATDALGNATTDTHTIAVSAPPSTGGGGTGGGGGGTGGGGGGGGTTLTIPVISGLSVTPATFRAARTGATIAARPIGARIAYRVSALSATRFVVQRLRTGIRKGGRCRPVPKHVKGHPKKCTRVTTAGRFAHNDAAGQVSLRFTGRVNGRKLPPGRYRLVVTGVNSAGTGKPVSAPFHVVR